MTHFNSISCRSETRKGRGKSIYFLKALFKTKLKINPIRPGLFSHSPGWEGAHKAGCKNQDYHQLMKRKICISLCRHKCMPDENLSVVAFLFLEM